MNTSRNAFRRLACATAMLCTLAKGQDTNLHNLPEPASAPDQITIADSFAPFGARPDTEKNGDDGSVAIRDRNGVIIWSDSSGNADVLPNSSLAKILYVSNSECVLYNNRFAFGYNTWGTSSEIVIHRRAENGTVTTSPTITIRGTLLDTSPITPNSFGFTIVSAYGWNFSTNESRRTVRSGQTVIPTYTTTQVDQWHNTSYEMYRITWDAVAQYINYRTVDVPQTNTNLGGTRVIAHGDDGSFIITTTVAANYEATQETDPETFFQTEQATLWATWQPNSERIVRFSSEVGEAAYVSNSKILIEYEDFSLGNSILDYRLSTNGTLSFASEFYLPFGHSVLPVSRYTRGGLLPYIYSIDFTGTELQLYRHDGSLTPLGSSVTLPSPVVFGGDFVRNPRDASLLIKSNAGILWIPSVIDPLTSAVTSLGTPKSLPSSSLGLPMFVSSAEAVAWMNSGASVGPGGAIPYAQISHFSQSGAGLVTTALTPPIAGRYVAQPPSLTQDPDSEGWFITTFEKTSPRAALVRNYRLKKTGNIDFDRDGLTNTDEVERGTDPNNPDSDADGINDGLEIYPYYLVTGRFTYEQAQQDAIRRGGFMAVLDTEAKRDALKSLLGTLSLGSKSWLGGGDPDRSSGTAGNGEGQYRWMGENGNFFDAAGNPLGPNIVGAPWAVNQPNNSGNADGLVLLNDYSWEMDLVNNSNGYVFQFRYSNPLVADSDGDGLTDAQELESGTDPNESSAGFPPPLSYVDFTNPDVNGNYEGLIVAANQGPTMSLTLKVSSKGGFSGSLQGISGKASLKGTFATNGTTTIQIKLGGTVSYLYLVIAPDSVSGIYRVWASLSASPGVINPSLVGELRRPIYNKTIPNPHAGSYTVVIPAPSTPATGQPAGDGYLVGTFKSDGKATFTGQTSDGQSLKWSGNLLEGDKLGFFSSFASSKGFADGYLNIRDAASTNGPSAMADLDGEIFINRVYSAGVSASYAFSSNAYGSLYRNASYNMLPSFSDYKTDADNSILIFSEGPYAGQIAVTTWATNNKWSLPKTQTRSLSGGINSKNGELTATYKYNDSANGYASSTAKLKGVILQKSGEVRGSYNMGAGSSGRIELLPNDGGLVAPVNIITPKSKSIGPQGGSYNIYITSSEPWDALISYDFSLYSTGNDWLTLSEDSGTGNGVITVEVAPNTNYSPRSGKITIAGITHTIRQNQAIYDPTGGGSGGGGGGGNSGVVINPVSQIVDWPSNSYQIIVTGYDASKSANPALDFVSPVFWATVAYTPGEDLPDGTPQGVATVFVSSYVFYTGPTRITQLTIGGVPHTLTQLW